MTAATSTGSLLLNPSLRGSGSAAARVADHTSLDVADLLDPVLRRAVDYFASALDVTSSPDCEYVVVGTTGNRRGFMLGSASAARWELPFVLVNSLSVDAEDELDAESQSAADAIRSLADELHVPVKDVLEAAGIKKRTFHSWAKPNGPRPRVTSQGRLWHLVSTAHDLRTVLDTPPHVWLHASPDRLALLRRGQFDDLVDLAFGRHTEVERRAAIRQAGLRPDIDVPINRSRGLTLNDEAVDVHQAKRREH